MTGKQKVIAIIGPTASGKSALAMEIARRCGAEILSVDSMQVYRGMDVGTAKPRPAERAMVPHHLLDVARPNENFSAARFVQLADAVIETRPTMLVATGGTPMYFKALFEGLFEGPGADETIRGRLRALRGAELHERLKRVDPAAAQRIHAADDRRLVRALEVFEITGKPISELQTQWERDHAPRVPAMWLGLHWDKEPLNRRINARVKDMIAAGWLDEVRRLLAEYGQLSRTAAEATGYSELIQHLRGQQSLADTIELIKIATRQLARRQMKWFRRFKNVRWLNGEEPLDSLVHKALQALQTGTVGQ